MKNPFQKGVQESKQEVIKSYLPFEKWWKTVQVYPVALKSEPRMPRPYDFRQHPALRMFIKHMSKDEFGYDSQRLTANRFTCIALSILSLCKHLSKQTKAVAHIARLYR